MKYSLSSKDEALIVESLRALVNWIETDSPVMTLEDLKYARLPVKRSFTLDQMNKIRSLRSLADKIDAL